MSLISFQVKVRAFEEKLLRAGIFSLVIAFIAAVFPFAFSYLDGSRDFNYFFEICWLTANFLPILTGLTLFLFWLFYDFAESLIRKRVLYLAIAHLLFFPLYYAALIIGVVTYCRLFGGCSIIF